VYNALIANVPLSSFHRPGTAVLCERELVTAEGLSCLPRRPTLQVRTEPETRIARWAGDVMDGRGRS
jgi:hypothetical protein